MLFQKIAAWCSVAGQWLSTVRGLKDARVRKVLFWLLVAAAVALVLWLVITIWGAMTYRAKQVFVIALLAVVSLLWFLRGLPWWERRRPSAKTNSGLGPGNSPEESEATRLMREALAEAKSLMSRSPHMDRTGDSLYSIPWFMVLGDASAPAETLLTCAARATTFAPPARLHGLKQYWHWWFFRGMVAIEGDSRLLCDLSDKANRGIWYQALELLRLTPERRRMPLNGIVLMLSMERLAGDPEELHRYVVTLRRLADECMGHLQVVVPIYLFIAATDQTPGYRAFLECLPPEPLAQAVGHRFEYLAREPTPSATQAEAVVTGFRDRLHQIRLAGIRREADFAKRKGVWDLVQGFEDVQGALKDAIRILLEANQIQRTPKLRGVYFVGTGGKGAFFADLFARLLPADQPLAERTKSPGLRRWFGSALSIALASVLSILITRQILLAVEDNERLRSIIETACAGVGAQTDLHSLANCSREIAKIETLRHDASLTWGIDQHESVLKKKKMQLISEFSAVLQHHDGQLQSDLDTRRIALGHVLSVVQRLWFISRCREEAESCRRVPDEPVLLFDPHSELFASVEPYTSRKPDRYDADSQNLIELYFAYLRWSGEISGQADFLEHKQTEARNWLRRLLGIRALEPKDFEKWSAAQASLGSAIALASFWGTAEGGKMAQVSPIFTRAAWQEVVRPALAESQISGTPKEEIKRFKQDYFDRYFLTWRDFLAAFDQGMRAVANKESSPGFVKRIIKEGSPYQLLWRSVRQNLYDLPLKTGLGSHISMWWDAIMDDWTSALGASGRLARNSYRRYTSRDLIVPPAWLETLRHTHEAGWRTMEARLQPFYASLEADGTGSNSHKLLGNLFASIGDESAELARIAKIIERGKRRYRLEPQDLPASEAQLGELRLLLALIGQRAGKQIDAIWLKDEYPEIKNMMSRDPNAAIGERVKMFCARNTARLVDCTNGARKDLLGATAPLSSWFVAKLGQQTAQPSQAAGRVTLGSIALAQPSTFGMIREGAKGTRVEVLCGEKKLYVDTKGESKDERRIDIKEVPGTCTEIRIKVALPDIESADVLGNDPDQAQDRTPANIIKTYKGDNVLSIMAEDFKKGGKSFDIADLRSSYDDEEWDLLNKQLRKFAIKQVRVYAIVGLAGDSQSLPEGTSLSVAIPTSLIQ